MFIKKTVAAWPSWENIRNAFLNGKMGFKSGRSCGGLDCFFCCHHRLAMSQMRGFSKEP